MGKSGKRHKGRKEYTQGRQPADPEMLEYLAETPRMAVEGFTGKLFNWKKPRRKRP